MQVLLKLFFTITHELPSRVSPCHGTWSAWALFFSASAKRLVASLYLAMASSISDWISWQHISKWSWDVAIKQKMVGFHKCHYFLWSRWCCHFPWKVNFQNAWQSVLLTRCHRLAQHWGQEVEKPQQRYGAQISWFTVKEQNTVRARQLENSFQIALELGCPVEFIFSPPWRIQISFGSQG